MKKLLAVLTAGLATLGLALAPGAFAQAPKADAKKTEAPKAEAPKADAKKAEPMDINSASEKELATLKGIGDARSAAIVKGRPYKGKDDLVKKKIIPESVYNDIKDQIIAKQAPAMEAPKDTKKK
jgi:DNA uptake protein ComE-like DNA-binding protein